MVVDSGLTRSNQSELTGHEPSCKLGSNLIDLNTSKPSHFRSSLVLSSSILACRIDLKMAIISAARPSLLRVVGAGKPMLLPRNNRLRDDADVRNNFYFASPSWPLIDTLSVVLIGCVNPPLDNTGSLHYTHLCHATDG